MPGRNIFARIWPNDHNNMQHPQMVHEKFYQFQIWANITQHAATYRNISQQGGQTHVTCWAQQCCDMLSWNGLYCVWGFNPNPWFFLVQMLQRHHKVISYIKSVQIFAPLDMLHCSGDWRGVSGHDWHRMPGSPRNAVHKKQKINILFSLVHS